jgi:hypothetical protein
MTQPTKLSLKRERTLKTGEQNIVNRNARGALRLLQSSPETITRGSDPLSDIKVETLKNLPPKSYEEEPEIVIEAIENYVDAIRFREKEVSSKFLHEDLGCLWGWQLCKTLGWEWVWVEVEADKEELAVVSPDRAYLVYPISLLLKNLEKSGGHNNTAACYNSLVNGQLPPSSPGKYLVIELCL